MVKAIIFDTETTGLNEPEIIEAAWLALTDPKKLKVSNSFYSRFKPSKPIELSAMAVHHILDEELGDDLPAPSEFSLPDDLQYLIGHNVDYDWKAIGSPDVKRICTLALSRHLWPELESHTQSVMMYFLNRADARARLVNAHSAATDVRNCLFVLEGILRHLGFDGTWEELWELSEMARVPTIMHFGKHKGTPIKEIPYDYKAWLLRQSDIDPYLIKALTS